MIKLCVLEDNLVEGAILRDYINSWGRRKSKSIGLDIIISYEDFLSLDSTFGDYDGFLLDIELPDGNGMMAANKVRDLGYKTPIAFITSTDSFVFEGYDVCAIKYLLKPINQVSIDGLMDRLYDTLPQKRYSFESNKVAYSVKFSDIVYFESNGHYIDIVTINATYKQRKNISCLTQELTEDFCQSYRTMIVNMAYVKTIKNSTIYLKTNQTLPLSKIFGDNFKKSYFKFHLNH